MREATLVFRHPTESRHALGKKIQAMRKAHHGCTVEVKIRTLRLRFRYRGRRYAFSTGLRDTPENRIRAEKHGRLVAATIAAGGNPLPLFETKHETKTKKAGPTVREYYVQWIADKHPPLVRRAQERDYRRHLEKYVLPRLGHLPIGELTARDVLGLRSALLACGLKGKPLTLKSVKNIVAGSFRAMCRDARILDRVLDRDPFDGVRWPRVPVPGPEPFTSEQRDRILTWFARKHFKIKGREGLPGGTRPFPTFHAFVHLLAWTGARPSEVIALRWRDVDLASGLFRVTRSRYLNEDSAPKTGVAARTVEMVPETIALLKMIQPLHVDPDDPVFRNTEGRQIYANTFLQWAWHPCLRALGIRMRGVYALKDTYISIALSKGVNISWLVGQTGVSYATMLKHYGTFLRSEGPDQLLKLTGPSNAAIPG